MPRVFSLLLFLLLLPACFSNPYCKRWGELECDRGCSRECLVWQGDTNWFERHVVGVGVTLVLNLGVMFALFMTQSWLSKRQERLEKLESERDSLRRKVAKLEAKAGKDKKAG